MKVWITILPLHISFHWGEKDQYAYHKKALYFGWIKISNGHNKFVWNWNLNTKE